MITDLNSHIAVINSNPILFLSNSASISLWSTMYVCMYVWYSCTALALGRKGSVSNQDRQHYSSQSAVCCGALNGQKARGR